MQSVRLLCVLSHSFCLCVCVFCIIEDHFSLTVCCQNKFLPTPDNFYWTHYQQISSHFGVGGIKVFNAFSKHSIKHQFSPPSSEYFIDVTVFGIRDLVSSLNLRFVLYYDIKSNRQTNRKLGCIAQRHSLTHIVILGMDFLWTILMLNFFSNSFMGHSRAISILTYDYVFIDF